ncbi:MULTISPECIES: ABC transporter permease [unclassified Shinella]|uniref:ABC transporter permease n=1 Tax=unclassified Shinella TaxID=2643062 RepID=UPI00234EF760|nr:MULTISPECIES: ABC transporter permease [unclassified Shinella]MCO5141130.1 ABC transporter permease [Shinella sp.]MDC7259989.1 ABC transporter permease [Shinella sp. YE25]
MQGKLARLKATGLRQDVVLLLLFCVMVLAFSLANPRFFSIRAMANILQDFSPVVLMAIGQTFVIASRGIDLSVGSVLGLAGVSMALVIRAANEAGLDPWLAISLGLAVAVGVGVVVGLINGILITYCRLVPFVATLATMGAAAGMSLVLTGGTQIAGAPKEVILLGNATYLGALTVPVIAVFVIIAVSWAFLSRARFGRWTYAIGSNPFAARGAGIDVERHLIKLYLLSGVLAALAGAFVYFRLGSGSPLSGRGGELNAIAAAVIGGVSLLGGTGKLTGVVIGALITTAVLSGLILIGVQPNWQQIVVAALIALAVGIQGLGARGGR